MSEARIAAARKKAADPVFRAKLSAAQRAARADPVKRANLETAFLAMKSDPTVRARRAATLRSPEVRDKLSRAAQTPEAMERFRRNTAGLRQDWLAPEAYPAILAAVERGERRIEIAMDWLITESRVSQIVRDARENFGKILPAGASTEH